MKISEILKNKSTISFEVFPPKNKEGDISSIYSTIEGLAKLSPDFISVTYGAGGSTKGKTVEIASVIKHEYGIEVINELPEEKFDSVVLAVAHQLFTGIDIESLSKTRSVVFDVKGFLPKESVDGRL